MAEHRLTGVPDFTGAPACGACLWARAPLGSGPETRRARLETLEANVALDPRGNVFERKFQIVPQVCAALRRFTIGSPDCGPPAEEHVEEISERSHRVERPGVPADLPEAIVVRALGGIAQDSIGFVN